MTPVILWIEDNPLDVQLLTQALNQAGVAASIIVAENALAAFRYMNGRAPYESSPRMPDLILLDLNLPALPGSVVLQEFRKCARLKYAPVVVLTSTLNARELRICTDMGACECITKPDHIDGYAIVVAKIKRYLPRSGADGAIDDDTPPAQMDNPPSSRISCGSTSDTTTTMQ